MSDSEHDRFAAERRAAAEQMAADPEMKRLSREWFLRSCDHQYSYNFTWMGRPIIQYPQDLVAMQEVIWTVQPDAIVETGIARGGSLVFYASMLALLGGDRVVVGVDIDIRPHNREAIESHPTHRWMRLVEGSSIDPDVVARVGELVRGRERVLVVLDSNHTHEHVLAELRAYAPLVTPGSYCVVFDTVVEDMPDECFRDRPWKRGNSPKSAVQAYLAEDGRFSVDRDQENKLLISVAPGGFLRRSEG